MLSMNKETLLLVVAAFVSANCRAAALDETSYSSVPKTDYGAQVNGGVQRMLRGNKVSPEVSDEERVGGESPAYVDFLQLMHRSNHEVPFAAVRNVPNEQNVQREAAIDKWIKDSGVNLHKVQDKVELLQHHTMLAKLDMESLMYMAFGSEFFEELVTKFPGSTFHMSLSTHEVDDIKNSIHGSLFSLNLVNTDNVLGKMNWLKHQKFGFKLDPDVYFYMAFGSELLQIKPASTWKGRWGKALSLAPPDTPVHHNHLEK